jgi:predicted permease
MRSQLRSYLRSLLHRRTVESDMEAELRTHLELRAQDLERTGLSPAEALRKARVEFGEVEKHKEDMRASLGLRLFDELRADLRYAARILRQSPGFTAVAVASLALGIGANTIIFTLAKGVLLDKLAVPHPGELRLFSVISERAQNVVTAFWGSSHKTPDGKHDISSLSYPVYQLLRQQNHDHPVMDDLFAFKDLDGPGSPTITVDGRAEVVTAQLVSGNFYQQMDVQPALGRGIQPSDDVAVAAPVVVISDGLWSRVFARSPAVIGRTIHLNYVPITIVGVNPPEFTGAASVQNSPDIFFPFSLQPTIFPNMLPGPEPGSLLTNTQLWWVQVMGRMLPGVSDAAARAAFDVWFEQDIRATMPVPKDPKFPPLVIESGSQGMANANERYAQPIYILSGLAGFVLLLACANLANLLLARSAARQREMSVRLALGASRGRVLRQVLTESLLLSSLGGAAGLAVGYAGRNVIPHILSSAWGPESLTSRFDLRLFAFTAGVSLLTGMLFGLAPAWQATRTEVNTGLKEAASSTTRRRKGLAGKTLIVFQVALSMVLVVGAGLFALTLSNLNHANLGFHPENLLLFAIQATPSRYPAPQDVALHQRIEERLARVPGVASITAVSNPVLANSIHDTRFQPTDQPKRTGDNEVNENNVGERFFETYRIPILYGRSFGSTDTAASPPVAVINEATARKFYAGINPVGKTFTPDEDVPPAIRQIIGVAADAKYDNLRDEPPPTFYKLYRQSKKQPLLTYVVKTSLPAAAILPGIRAAVQEIDKDLPIRDVRTQVQQIDATVSQERLFATLTAGFGLLALVLACIGIYGIMAYDVARRTSEIGIRIALGAKAGQMLRMMLREVSWMAAIGIGSGVGAALLLTRFVSSMLYGLKGNDPVILAGAAGLLFAVALLSGWRPARKASRIEPMEALRHE